MKGTLQSGEEKAVTIENEIGIEIGTEIEERTGKDDVEVKLLRINSKEVYLRDSKHTRNHLMKSKRLFLGGSFADVLFLLNSQNIYTL